MSPPRRKMTVPRRKRPQAQTTIALLARQIEFHKTEIGKHRDALRDLINDAESVAGTCADAVESLEHAVDTLSQYV